MRLRRSLLALPLLLAMAACDPSEGSAEPTTVPATSAGASTTAASNAPASNAPATIAVGTTAPATTAPSTTTAAGDAGAAATVTGYFESLGLPVTAEEAACLAGRFDQATTASLADAIASGAEPDEATQTAVFQAIVTCEPESYAAAQIEAIVSLGSTSEADAACIVTANNALLRDNAAVLALAAGQLSLNEWPPEEKAELRAALVTCVAGDVADRIIAG